MKKVALCLSGHVRTYPNCKDGLFLHIISRYNPDVFIHTWDEYGYGLNGRFISNINDETIKKIEENKKYGASNVEFIRGGQKLSESFFDHLEPKLCIVEDYSNIEKEILDLSDKIKNKNSYDYPPNFISAQRKTLLCNNLRKKYEEENNIKYDLVIKTRFDLLYNNVVLDFDSGKLHVPTSESYGIMSDIFSFCNGEIMDKYVSFFNYIEKYAEENLFFNPHYILLEHINKQKIDFIFDPNLDLNILK